MSATSISAFGRVSQIAARRQVHAAFQWLHLNEQAILRAQAELVSVPAPPFAEQARAEWLAERFRQVGLEGVCIDGAGNVLGTYRSGEPSPFCVLLSAHIDTVFPAETPIRAEIDGTRLLGPGACDNGAGVVGLLALATALREAAVDVPCDLIFAGNTGEEGEGDLRGIRYLYEQSPLGGRIAANLVLDGAGHEVAVTQALGSRRFLVTIHGPGGHSWTDAGRPNPIVILSEAISRLSSLSLAERPRTTLNVGTIEGGTAVNAIPETASARFDLRSTSTEQLTALEVRLHRAVEDAVIAANQTAAGEWQAREGRQQPLRFSIELIGDRPAGFLPEEAPLFEALRAVDRHLAIRTEVRVASTDANIPLARGLEALSLGAGGDGGGVHTRREWYDGRGRELGLRRVLLLLLAAAEQVASRG